MWYFEVVFESQKRLIQKQVALNQNLTLTYKSTGWLSARKDFLSGNYMTDKDWVKAGESLGDFCKKKCFSKSRVWGRRSRFVKDEARPKE